MFKRTLLAIAVVSGFAAFGSEIMEDGRFTVLNIIPSMPGHEDIAAADAKEYAERTGCEHVLYSMTLHPEGKPAMAKVDKILESYRIWAKKLEGTAAKPGILLQAIIGHWPRVDKEIEPWQRTINIKGDAVRFCIFDERYQAYVREVGRKLAAEHPSVILGDDDIRMFSPHAECFCPLHTAEYNRRTGKNLSSDELRKFISKLDYRDGAHKAFTDLQEDTIKLLLTTLRSGIDSVDPSIPAGVCQPGWVWERARIGRYARTLAGNHRPFFRLGNGWYREHLAKTQFPQVLTASMASFEPYRDFPYVISEADTWPQNLWSKSAVSYHADLVAGAFVGMKGAKVWYVNAHRGVDYPVTRHYTKVMADHRGYYDGIVAAIAGKRMHGLVVPLFEDFPCQNVKDREPRIMNYVADGWAERIFGVYGIPYRTSYDLDEKGAVYALGGSQVIARCTDAQLKMMLSHKVLIDCDAALALIARGFSKEIGVELAADQKPGFTTERWEKGRAFDVRYSSTSKKKLFKTLDGADVLANHIWRPYTGASEFERVAPSATLFENSLCGKVAFTAYHFAMRDGTVEANARQDYLFKLIAALEPSVAEYVSANDQNTVTLVRRGGADDVLVVFNLNTDPTGCLKFRLAARPEKVERLGNDGKFQAVAFEYVSGLVTLPIDLPCYGETVLRITK